MITFENSELRPLLRALLAGKFSSELKDPEVVASPIVAAIITRIADLVDEMDALECSDSTRLILNQWRHIDPCRDEWGVAIRFAKLYFLPNWFQWESARQRLAIANLFAPFYISDKNIDLFIKAMHEKGSA